MQRVYHAWGLADRLSVCGRSNPVEIVTTALAAALATVVFRVGMWFSHCLSNRYVMLWRLATL